MEWHLILDKLKLLVSLLVMPVAGIAQHNTHWQLIDSGTRASFRGLSVPSDSVIWVTGTRGTFVHSFDGGKTWQADSMAGATHLDFRDVHAVDAHTVYMMSAGPGERSRIYKTTDGGRSWKLQFTMPDSAGFLDGFEFWEGQRGIAFGDPLEGRLFVITTTDGGNIWLRIPPENIPPVIEGEFAFAASGTSIAVQGKSQVWIGTGGAAARVFHSNDGGHSWTVANTPLSSGSESAGIFSLAFRDEKNGVAVGGDYRKPAEAASHVIVTKDGGQTWEIPKSAQLEFRSGVVFIPQMHGQILIAVGTSGADSSGDGGLTWKRIDAGGFNVVSAGSSRASVWAAGPEGKIARLIVPTSR
ncbi:MAG: WD40/YVTN/BNR-like repeat-containing protein [bacterium]